MCDFLPVRLCHKNRTVEFFRFFTRFHQPSSFPPDESGAWSYREPGVNFKEYTTIIILDPLVIWPSQHSEYGGLDALPAWRLALAFQESMSLALAGGYVIVKDPGPGVLRLRAALTDVMLERPALASPAPLLPLANDFLIQS